MFHLLHIKEPFLLAVVDSLIGSENRSTDSVNVNRISVLYYMMVESIQTTNFLNLDFARQVGSYICVATYMYMYICECIYAVATGTVRIYCCNQKFKK